MDIWTWVGCRKCWAAEPRPSRPGRACPGCWRRGRGSWRSCGPCAPSWPGPPPPSPATPPPAPGSPPTTASSGWCSRLFCQIFLDNSNIFSLGGLGDMFTPWLSYSNWQTAAAVQGTLHTAPHTSQHWTSEHWTCKFRVRDSHTQDAAPPRRWRYHTRHTIRTRGTKTHNVVVSLQKLK